jgi:hypothetical protein
VSTGIVRSLRLVGVTVAVAAGIAGFAPGDAPAAPAGVVVVEAPAVDTATSSPVG